jgi:hypothetical protein
MAEVNEGIRKDEEGRKEQRIKRNEKNVMKRIKMKRNGRGKRIFLSIFIAIINTNINIHDICCICLTL